MPLARPAASAAPTSAQRSRSSRPDLLRRENRLRRLRMRTDNQRISDRTQPPSRRDARDLPRGVLTVAAGADQRRVGTAVDTVQRGIVAAIEEVLHLPRQRGEILRRGEDIPIGRQHIIAAGIWRGQQTYVDVRLAPRALGRGFRHLACATGQRVIYDQQRFHGSPHRRNDVERRRPAHSSPLGHRPDRHGSALTWRGARTNGPIGCRPTR